MSGPTWASAVSGSKPQHKLYFRTAHWAGDLPPFLTFGSGFFMFPADSPLNSTDRFVDDLR